MCVDDEIPVSVVDMDVPVTAIDEVICDNLTGLSAYEPALLRSNQDKQDGSTRQTLDVRNKNNNARISNQASVTPSRAKPSQNPAVSTYTRSEQNAPESRLWPPAEVQNRSKESTEVDRASSGKTQNMICQNPVSRFGLKTFTVVPTKPVAAQNQIRSEASLGIGAIKIDELGNMVARRETRDKSDRLDEASDDRDSPLLDKAKAFWSSANKEDSAPTAYYKAGDVGRPLESLKPPPVTVASQATEKSSVTEPPKQVGGPSPNLASAVMKKLAVSDPAENIFFSEHRKNLTFLKPSRRTSSHYVASAITKYTGNTSSKVDGAQEPPESASAGQKTSPSQAFKNDLRPVQVVSNRRASNASANSVPFPAGAKPYPAYTAEKQEVSREPQVIGTSTQAQNPSPVHSKPQQQARISTHSEPAPSSSKEHLCTKKAPGNPLSSTVSTTRPAVAKKPEFHSLGLQPSPFGPVKKFKPVVPKSMEKETSLHSSLMEAIQSGEGMERLRKVNQETLFFFFTAYAITQR